MKPSFFKNRKKTNSMKDALAPRKEFLEGGKARFLAAFDVRYGTTSSPAHRTSGFMVAMRIAGVLVAVAGITIGASVYADTANVSATNVLYPLKRLDESVQLAVAPASEKPQLEANFAARRANEIAQIEAASSSSATSSLVISLKADLDQKISASLNDASNTNLQDGSLARFCGAYDSLSGLSSLNVAASLIANPGLLLRLEARCGNTGGSASSSAGFGSPSSSTSSTNATSGPFYPGGNHRSGINGKKIMSEEGTSESSSVEVIVSSSFETSSPVSSSVYREIDSGAGWGYATSSPRDEVTGFLKHILPQVPLPALKEEESASTTSGFDGVL